MRIVERKIDELNAAVYNPRKLTEAKKRQLKHSLDKFGLVDPIIVNMNKDRKNIIVGGHQRLKIWKEFGNATIFTVEVDLDKGLEKELNVRLNKNTGEFDNEILVEFFGADELMEWSFEADEMPEFTVEDDGDIIPDYFDDQRELPGMEARLYEHHDYIVMVFDNMHDFVNAINKLGIKKVNSSFSDKNKKIGIGRVVNGNRVMEMIPDEAE